MDKLPGNSNYYLGKSSDQWIENVPSYGKVKIHEAYPGIDIVFYAPFQQQLEYDLIVKAGADASQISIDFDPKLRHPR